MCEPRPGCGAQCGGDDDRPWDMGISGPIVEERAFAGEMSHSPWRPLNSPFGPGCDVMSGTG